MKKIVSILIVVTVIFLLTVAAAWGMTWYRENHVFIEEDAYPLNAKSLDLREKDISLAYYNELKRQLPDCEITWMVPFQGGRYDSAGTDTVKVSAIRQDEADFLGTYLPGLRTLDAAGSRDYDVLSQFRKDHPDCRVIYEIDLGDCLADPDAAELELNPGEYDYDTMMENLVWMERLTSLTLRTPDLTPEQLDAVGEKYPALDFSFTVDILGTEYDRAATELDLSALESSGVSQAAEKLSLFPDLTRVELMNGVSSRLRKEDVKALMDAAPGAAFHYVFDFFGQAVSPETEEVSLKNMNIGDEGEAEIRAALDLMTGCKRLVLDNCKLSNEVLAQIREDYRGRTKVVWRVWFGKGSTLTDAELLRAVYGLKDSNCHDLIYCEDVVCMDIGHNEYLNDCSFVSGMVNLEYCIISGSPIKDLTPFANCTKLKFLELAFCGYLNDASPLASCTSLEMLNISNTKIVDLSPLDGLPLTNLIARMYPGGRSRVSAAERTRFTSAHPDCWAGFDDESQPYGKGWRYDTDGTTLLPAYAQIRDWMRYLSKSGVPNHVGWYID